MKILSFGGGIQSTALAILAAQRKIHVDAIIFCDTGFEQSIVFDFLEKYTKPMLEKAAIPFFIAKTEDYAGTLHGKTTFGNLELPPFFNIENGETGREPAFCSSKWKSSVFNRFLAEKFNKKSYDVQIGFSTDEIQRAARMVNEKKFNQVQMNLDIFSAQEEQKKAFEQMLEIEAKKNKSAYKKYSYQFPLLDLKMNRTDCTQLVEKTFNAEPPRSSCFFCPNHTQMEWKKVMESKDREILIKFDKGLRKINRYLTAECKPITECTFDSKNETFFSRTCSGSCFS